MNAKREKFGDPCMFHPWKRRFSMRLEAADMLICSVIVSRIRVPKG